MRIAIPAVLLTALPLAGQKPTDPRSFIPRDYACEALVPAPRRHLVTYHGVLAGAAQDRDRVVPAPGGSGKCRHLVELDDGSSREDEVAVRIGSEERPQSRKRARFVPHRPERSGG